MWLTNKVTVGAGGHLAHAHAKMAALENLKIEKMLIEKMKSRKVF